MLGCFALHLVLIHSPSLTLPCFASNLGPQKKGTEPKPKSLLISDPIFHHSLFHSSHLLVFFLPHFDIIPVFVLNSYCEHENFVVQFGFCKMLVDLCIIFFVARNGIYIKVGFNVYSLAPLIIGYVNLIGKILESCLKTIWSLSSFVVFVF